MDINIRKATKADLAAIEDIYDRILTEEERGRAKIGWVRGVYLTRATAEAALEADELFVEEADGRVVGVAIINGKRVDAYAGAPWMYDVPDSRITVLHTLVIDPLAAGRGLGTAFVSFSSAMRQSADARICAWIPIRRILLHVHCIKSSAIARSTYACAALTVFPG